MDNISPPVKEGKISPTDGKYLAINNNGEYFHSRNNEKFSNNKKWEIFPYNQ